MYEYMKEAIEEGKKAYKKGEVPIGTIIVKDEKIIARGHNLKEINNDPTAHAEIIAIRQASKMLKGWRLDGCDLYVTIEPCPMCAGAILQSRIKTLIYGAPEPKFGGVDTIQNILNQPKYNHNVQVIGGIMEEECSQLMKDFFEDLRKKN